MDWLEFLVNNWHVRFVCAVLIIAAYIDGKQLRVPNWLTYPMVFAGLAFNGATAGWSGLGDSLRHPVTDGVIAGLVIGKPLGVFLTAFLLARFTHAALDDDLAWRDVIGVSLLAGIGFTMSLFIAGRSFPSEEDYAAAKIGIFLASFLAGGLGAAILWRR